MSSNYLAKLNLRAFRYCVLVVFLICSALTASIGAWNLGIVQGIGASGTLIQRIDSYLAFLGGSGLIILFTVAFVELSRISWFIATVWFECVWVSMWGLMYLAAAITVTVIASQEDCSTTDQTLKCVSLQVLLVFTWLCALTLIIYFPTFMFAVFINKKKDPTIWRSMMRRFPWAGTCAILASPPTTPTLPAFVHKSTVPIIHAPKPKHAQQSASKRATIFSWRSGFSHEYQIEHYRPPTSLQTGPDGGTQHTPSCGVKLPPAAAPPVMPALPPNAEPETPENNFASSLYPMYMQQPIYTASTSKPARPEPALSRASTHVTQAPVHAALPAPPPPPPPPLGNWPRPDILSQPVTKRKRKLPVPIVVRGDFESDNSVSAVVTSSHVPPGTRQREREIHSQSPPRTSFQHTRPVGPRRRSGSSDLSNRPPALERLRIEYV